MKTDFSFSFEHGYYLEKNKAKYLTGPYLIKIYVE